VFCKYLSFDKDEDEDEDEDEDKDPYEFHPRASIVPSATAIHPC
jgi:hypothetical protein